MNQKEKQMVERIMDTEAIGYAYLYPAAGGERKEYLISTTPENLANFVGGPFHGCPADDSNGYAGSADLGYGRWIFESVSESESLP